MVVPPPLSKFSSKKPLFTLNVSNNILMSICTITMYLFRFLTPLANKNVQPQTPAVIHRTVQKIIPVVIFLITCRTPGKPAAGEEWKYGPAKSKSTGSNFSRLLKTNFRYNNDTEKQSRSSGNAYNNDTSDRADGNNTGRNDRAWKSPQLRTVCNADNSLNSYRTRLRPPLSRLVHKTVTR
jgi:hypothetical protein